MKYDVEVNDTEVLMYINEEDEESKEILIEKYKPLVKTIAHQYSHGANLMGIDESDLIQEGLIGLIRAIRTYDIDKEASFYTYASLCIDSDIKNLIRHSKTHKFEILNSSVSLDNLLNDEDDGFYEIIGDNKTNPSNQILERETEEENIKLMKDLLAPFEFKVFRLKLEGFSNKEISIVLNKDKKSIENTVARIRVKYKNMKKHL